MACLLVKTVRPPLLTGQHPRLDRTRATFHAQARPAINRHLLPKGERTGLANLAGLQVSHDAPGQDDSGRGDEKDER